MRKLPTSLDMAIARRKVEGFASAAGVQADMVAITANGALRIKNQEELDELRRQKLQRPGIERQ